MSNTNKRQLDIGAFFSKPKKPRKLMTDGKLNAKQTVDGKKRKEPTSLPTIQQLKKSFGNEELKCLMTTFNIVRASASLRLRINHASKEQLDLYHSHSTKLARESKNRRGIKRWPTECLNGLPSLHSLRKKYGRDTIQEDILYEINTNKRTLTRAGRYVQRKYSTEMQLQKEREFIDSNSIQAMGHKCCRI